MSSRNIEIEQLKRSVYEAVARLQESLDCKVLVNSGENYFDIIIPIEDFIRALIRKVKRQVGKDVLNKINIKGTRVYDFMIIRLEVVRRG